MIQSNTTTPSWRQSNAGRLVFLLSMIGACALFLTLGSWQVQRLHWKENLIATQEKAAKAPPAPLSKEALQNPEAYHLREFSLQGRFLPEQTLKRAGIYHDKKLGSYLLTPFRLLSGEIILIQRGWISEAKPLRVHTPQSITALYARLRIPPTGRMAGLLPDHQPEQKIWHWMDIPSMAQHLKQSSNLTILPLYFQQTKPLDVENQPQIIADLPTLHNDHLGYAITWFALAFVVAGYTVYWHRIHRNQA